MAHPQPDRSYVDETKIAFGGVVVSGCDAAGVLELVEAALDHVAKSVKPVIDTDAHLAGLAHRNLGQDIALIHGFPNAVSIIAAIRQQHARLWQVVIHHQIEPQIVRCLPRRDVCSHWQSMRVDAEVDLGRETTS